MIISYHILILSIFTLSQVSEFSVINSTSSDYNKIDGNGKPLTNDENNWKLEENSKNENQINSNLNGNFTDSADFTRNADANHMEPPSPDVPNLSNNITMDDVKQPTDTNLEVKVESKVDTKMDPVKQPETGTTSKDEPILSANATQTKSNSDEMPTFDEYRQKLEKESKQKREKADSVPSSPTMIIKDKVVVKTVETINSQSLVKENIEPVRSGSSLSPPNNGQDTNNQDIVKVDLKVRQIPLATEDVKLDARTATLTKKLLKNNVAAKECGAKMLEFSGQITNADFVLNNNKDEYLNVPCSISEKWFIIETCEPVQIRSIQIANFEMFSSRPKTFKVYSSDRYPVKHWYNMGLFRAHDEKGVQTFTISDTNMVKYIKFEMVDHYGNEHYCPLTFVRILGNVVIDEIDEEAEDNQQSPDDDAPIDNSEFKINNDGILTKAKDILVKMVNGIGGTKKSDTDESFQYLTNRVNKFDENNSHLIVTESPCYFIDFLTKNTHLNCDIIFTSFQRLVESEKYLSCDSKTSLVNQIISEPFPFQIRVNYFTIYQFLYNSQFEFPKLHHSFLNLTLHSKDLCIQNHWQNLSSIFKCNLILNRNTRFDEPRLPNITGNSDCSKTVSMPSSPTVDIPNTLTSEQSNKDIPPTQIPSQNEPITDNNHVKGSSISSYPLPSNDTKVEELNHQDKNGTIENSNPKDQRSDKVVNHQNKESELESNDMLSFSDNQNKLNSVKSRQEDIADQKFLASPGSNAWNQAFMRIKNMAKQLEVNVSISMKYLEELSQNYKQQTERLKKAQSSMSENVSNLELIIHQHRLETQKSIQDLNSQLQILILKIKYSFSLRKHLKSRSKFGFNLSDSPDLETKCVDLLDDDLFVSSWWESPFVMIFTNVIISVICNLMFLIIFYNRLKNKIISDIQGSQIFSSKSNLNSHDFSYIEDLPIFSPSRSCTDLTNSRISQHPVVLPPRGVNFSFYNSDSVLNTDYAKQNQNKTEFGPHFYAVQPNFNFVTPSKRN